ncbi:hypothetical protein FOZ60_009530 [Perkinsus olseni]|uniref:Uncharacterized protein n=1 Tax=Perkinsus olseni TaxID=32597 RepID=A0A7J6NIB6_PEROL|nr:hypothetical protein FOZ60_009530 [Perkinsus olseni]
MFDLRWIGIFSLCRMLTPISLLSLYILGSATPSVTEFYKEVSTPWDHKQTPWCWGCPTCGNYTWDYYFNYTLDMGVRNYMLNGYYISRESILKTTDSFAPLWDKHGFMSLRLRVKGRGGRILADLRDFWFPSWNETFNKTAFVESVKNFTKDYPVDGFILGFPHGKRKFWKTDITQAMKECFEAIEELRMVSALSFLSRDWHRVEDAAFGRIADLNFVYLTPYGPDFITDLYAEEVIKNATLAGVKKETLVLGIALQGNPPVEGYSTAILDYHGDPKGDGVVKTKDGDVYFNSQKRATDKLLLAERFGLHGVYLRDGYFYVQDLLPWDKRSLFYALAQEA